MNFVEERTPRGYLLKIFLEKWQFLAFDKKGKSIYVDKEGRSLLHPVPVIIFVGVSFDIKREYDRAYNLMKIRNGAMVVPYRDVRANRTKYFFLKTEKDLDMIPVRLFLVGNVAQMVRDIDASIQPDYVVVDDAVTPNDVVIIKNRYKVEEIIYIELVNNYFLAERLQIPDTDRIINLNMMSTNPVFLARIHLRNMDLAKINQLLLDFEITALDTEYILNFIQTVLDSGAEDPAVQKNRPMLMDLHHAFKFYHSLLQKNEAAVRDMINSIDDPKKLTPYRTLVSKVKAMFPGVEEQKLYTEYENIVYDRSEALKAGSSV
jgi:hypothetical protein